MSTSPPDDVGGEKKEKEKEKKTNSLKFCI
jgi:hypothetical protein